jgi:hypothetical protein
MTKRSLEDEYSELEELIEADSRRARIAERVFGIALIVALLFLAWLFRA